MIQKFLDYIKVRKATKEPEQQKTPKEFTMDEFNEWFKTEFDGYDGRKGAPGIFLRTDKLSPHWILQYLEYIGQDTSEENVDKYYIMVRKDWINQL